MKNIHIIILLSFYCCSFLRSQVCEIDSIYKVDVIKKDTVSVEYFTNSLLMRKKEFIGSTTIVKYYTYRGGVLEKEVVNWIMEDGTESKDSILYEYKEKKLVRTVERRSDANAFNREVIEKNEYRGDTIIKVKSYGLGKLRTFKIDNLDGTYWWYNNYKNPSLRKLQDKNDSEIKTDIRQGDSWVNQSVTESSLDACQNISESITKATNGSITKHFEFIIFYRK